MRVRLMVAVDISRWYQIFDDIVKYTKPIDRLTTNHRKALGQQTNDQTHKIMENTKCLERIEAHKNIPTIT